MNPLLFKGVFIKSAKTANYGFFSKMNDLINRGEIYQYIYTWILFIKQEDDSFIILSSAFSGNFIENFKSLKWKLLKNHTYSHELVDFYIDKGLIKVKHDNKTTSKIWFNSYEKSLIYAYFDTDKNKEVQHEFLYFPWN